MSDEFDGTVYLFFDEGGNFDFSRNGTKYFTLTCVATVRPFLWDAALQELRYDLLETGKDLQCFHATNDKQPVRDKVFAVIQDSLSFMRVDSLIVEKSKTHPSQREATQFYPCLVSYLLHHALLTSPWRNATQAIAITDRIPISRKQMAIRQAVKGALNELLPPETHYQMHHYESKSCWGLQVADYINWAIQRAWEKGDNRSLVLVESAVKSQFELYARSDVQYYER